MAAPDLSFLQGRFNSELPPEVKIIESWADPGFRADFDVDLGRNAMLALRYAAGHTLELVPSQISDYGEIVTKLTAVINAPNVEVASRTFEDLHAAVLDTAMSAVGAVPIVGQLMKGIVSIMSIFARWLAKDNVKPKPQVQGYTKEGDDWEAFQIQRALRTNDWTKIFLPRTVGPWKRIIAETRQGDLVHVFMPGNDGPGLGALPGTSDGLGGIVYDLTGMRPKITWPLVKEEQVKIIKNTTDLYQQRPSAMQLGGSVWAFLMSTDSAAILNVDAGALRQPWLKLVGDAQSYTNGLRGTPGEIAEGNVARQNIAAYYAIRSQLKLEGKWYSEIVIDAVNDLRARQIYAVRSLPRGVIEGRVALRDPKVAEAFDTRPFKLAMRYKVKKPLPPRMPVGGALGPRPKKPTRLVQWLVAAGLGGGAYYAYKNRRRLVKVFS